MKLASILFIMMAFYSTGVQAKTTLTITSLNIKWFGLGGEYSASKSDEFRTPWIKEFLTEKIGLHDIFVFQEITDVKRLKSLMSSLDYECTSYTHKRSNHQKMAICHKDQFSLKKPSIDNNFLIEDVANVGDMQLRPALYGTLVNKRTKKELLTLTTVHLKASWNHTDTRISQSEIIKNQLAKLSSKKKVIVIGDFNTYASETTRLDKDDTSYISEVFKDINLKQVKHKFQFTYSTRPNRGLLLDHAWVRNMKVTEVSVWKACNQNFKYPKRFESISFYNKFVSDHCPLTLKVEI